MHLSIVLFIQR